MEAFLTNCRFIVSIGSGTYGFSKVSNLVQELEYDSIQEGGRNYSPVFFRKPKSRFDTLTLEKGVQAKEPVFHDKPLATGMRLEGVIIFIGDGDNGYLKYTFDEGIVTKIELDPLDAMGSSVLIGKMEIIHSGLRTMSGKGK